MRFRHKSPELWQTFISTYSGHSNIKIAWKAKDCHCMQWFIIGKMKVPPTSSRLFFVRHIFPFVSLSFICLRGNLWWRRRHFCMKRPIGGKTAPQQTDVSNEVENKRKSPLSDRFFVFRMSFVKMGRWRNFFEYTLIYLRHKMNRRFNDSNVFFFMSINDGPF